jgi:inosine/xanthosine triphosphatase
MELGDADDAVFKTVNSKQGQGTIGALTHGIISRRDYYVPAIIMAHIPFNFPTLY